MRDNIDYPLRFNPGSEVRIEKILVVDDDDCIRQIAQIGLEDDFIVITAASGAEALQTAAREKPDLILLDRMMPGMDGVATLSKLRELETTRSIPVIFLTAKVQRDEMENYAKLEVAGVLAKPFDPMNLADDIRKITDNL